MLPNPLHPAVVHFPMVFAVLLPISAALAMWAIQRGTKPLRAWAVPVAFALAAQGVKLLLCGRRSLPLANVTQKIKETGGECSYMTADVSVAADVDKLVNKAADTYGTVHILINNAVNITKGAN